MASYTKLAGKVFANKSISVKRRKRLGWSLIVSRLCYNSQTWPKLKLKARNTINAVYMRLWRRIAGDPQCQNVTKTNREIRQMLQIPSIDCYLRKRRLKYAARVIKNGPPALIAALQTRTKTGEPTKWVQTVAEDIRILQAHPSLASKLRDMPKPENQLRPWLELFHSYPAEWSAIVDQYFTIDDDQEYEIHVPKKGIHTFGQKMQSKKSGDFLDKGCCIFECCTCSKAFASGKQLATHKWKVHGIKSDVRSKVADISVCPICHTDYHCRARLIKHLLEKRIRSKTRGYSCHQKFLERSARMPDVPKETLMALEARDAQMYREARKQGHSNLIVYKMPIKQSDHILKGCNKKGPKLTINKKVVRRRLRGKQPPPKGFVI